MAPVNMFGFLPDGTGIANLWISGGGLSVGIIGYGASIRELTFDPGDGPRRTVLGLQTIDDYLAHASHMGAIAGRYANRIAAGRFTLDGREIELNRKPGETHHLHGGVRGFGKRAWKVVERGTKACALELVSPDGDEGYPGQVTARCRYAIAGDGILRIELTAVTDAPTVVNLAPHSYFNLDGGPDVLDHVLEIAAEAYTPVDADLIPTGDILPVAGTDFDFRRPRPIRLERDGGRVAYDHNFVVARDRAVEPRFIARATGPKTGTTLEVWSTEPGLQVYDAAKMNIPVPGTGGRTFGPAAGFCLEPQLFPDTPNRPDFGSAELRPGETYRQVTEYRFSAR
ncbi:aldose epimerase family protein [Prosthecomicrobium hirschii]|nr:aldose epimerase family protein [Prosthecomicrobium hirschii]